MKKCNYHTHTPRCHHAIGSEEEYILNAIQAGFDELGFADHTPWHYESDFTGLARMEEDKLEDYVSTLKRLKEKYKDQISIKIGLEAEYFEDKLPWLLKKKEELGIDYLICGHHYHISDEINQYNGVPFMNESKLIDYVEDIIQAIHSGYYIYIAHPDLINYKFLKKEFYKTQMTRIIQEAIKYDLPLEFNLLGFREQRNYPNPIFWKLVSKYKAKAIIGFDAHTPASLLDDTTYDKAIQYLKDLDIEIIEKIEM